MQCSARFLAALVALGGAACAPTIDLRGPLCFVTTGSGARSTEVARQGVDAWLAPLKRATGTEFPAPLFVAEPRACRGTNPPIVMRMTCGRRNPVGIIYSRPSFRGYEIFLNEQTGGLLPGVSTHEIGHALLGWGHVTHRPSLMNPYLGDPRPTASDIELLCAQHPEVPRCRLSIAHHPPPSRTTWATVRRR